MDLHDMKRTKEERKERTSDVAPMSVDEVEYPYGLGLNLEKESLDKLGLDADDFNIDTKVEMVCTGEITSIHESANKDNNHTSVNVQITKMAMLVKPNVKKVTLKDVMAAVKSS